MLWVMSIGVYLRLRYIIFQCYECPEKVMSVPGVGSVSPRTPHTTHHTVPGIYEYYREADQHSTAVADRTGRSSDTKVIKCFGILHNERRPATASQCSSVTYHPVRNQQSSTSDSVPWRLRPKQRQKKEWVG